MDADLHSDLLAKAAELGFAKIGICAPNAIKSAQAGLNGYLAAGYHGTMEWMEGACRLAGLADGVMAAGKIGDYAGGAVSGGAKSSAGIER